MTAVKLEVVSPEMQKLEELRARRAALAEARTARAQPTLEEQIAVEERALAEDEAIDKAEQEHGKLGTHIAVVETPAGRVIVKRPTMAAYRRFMDRGEISTSDLEVLVRPCLVYPSRAEIDQIWNEYPAMLKLIADAVVQLAGHRIDKQREK